MSKWIESENELNITDYQKKRKKALLNGLIAYDNKKLAEIRKLKRWKYKKGMKKQ